MPSDKTLIATIVLVIVILIVFAPLLSLFLSARRGEKQESNLFKGLGNMTKPWEKEEKDVDELSRRIQELKSTEKKDKSA